MKYNQPFDKPSDPNASYVDASSASATDGSMVPAAGVEFDQREIVEIIRQANSRGYIDFTGVPCPVAANGDLQQLRKAIEGFVRSWNFVIDSEVTFNVHGPGADFPDLISAMRYLGHYRITPHGHVTLQLAGANPTRGYALQYIYTETIYFQHPSNDRISVLGAPMLMPLPFTDDQYAINGHSTGQRLADAQTNLGILRSKFATELVWQGQGPISPLAWGGAAIWVTGISLMDLDAILATTSPGGPGTAFMFTCSGYMNYQTHHSGLAAVYFNCGFNWDDGGHMSIQGEGLDIHMLTSLVAVGCGMANNPGSGGMGAAVTNGGFVTSWGNMVCINGDGNGLYMWPRSGSQWDGGMYFSANAFQGLQTFHTSDLTIGATAGVGELSHIWRNGQWGMYVQFGQVNAEYTDFGEGTSNQNAAGSVVAQYGSGVACGAPARCSPPPGVVGNGNAIVG